jgi:TetR/AcrR family transcriptional regulator
MPRTPGSGQRRPKPRAVGSGKKRTIDNGSGGAIRRRNQAKILKAAEAVFAKHGFDGATTGEIARRAGMPKANLHYYFRTKQALYAAILDHILDVWLDAMDEIRADAEPADALARYIERKLDSSRTLPTPSRLWAMELIGGAHHVDAVLRGRLRRLVRRKSTIIKSWIAAGKIAPIDPPHLLFMIWAMTQTYADFAAQIAGVLGKKQLDDEVFATAGETMVGIMLRGLGLSR